MAEAVTYADLRFVKAPLKKSISSQLGRDPEADEDGELTYENVQVPPTSGGASNLASSGLWDKAGVPSELPTAPWSSVTSPAAGRLLGSHPACSKYILLLGLLLTCLVLGMATISLGVRYLQVSRQLQHTNRVLEATNSSLRQQLHQRIAQAGQQEQELQTSRRELAQSQEALQVEQRDCQAVKEQLQACQSDGETTKKALQREEEQRRNLQERLNHVQDTLKPFFTCPSPDACCPTGWIQNERSCFYISLTKRTWEESQSYCKSLSSNLAKQNINSYSDYYNRATRLRKVLPQDYSSDSYWVILSWNKDQHRYDTHNQRCVKLAGRWFNVWSEDCSALLPCICEIEVFRYPDGDHSSQ